MLWLGLTGGLGTGKSTVSTILRGLGYLVVDADVLAKEALAPESPAYPLVVKDFGPEILNLDGSINRSSLAGIVFQDQKKLAMLESLTHPLVQQAVQKQRKEAELRGDRIAFYDVPLLFEKKLQKDFAAVIVVTCKPDLQWDRIRSRNSWSDAEINNRIKSQVPLNEKEKLADYLIENNGSLSELETSVREMIKFYIGKS